MDSSPPQIPNLASILQTLATYAPRQPVAPQDKSDLEEGEYDPCQYNPIHSATAFPPQPPPPSIIKPDTPILKAVAPPSPSGITTWPKALNYTIQYIFSNPDKKRRIKDLIQTQHRHEREWWTSREEVIRKAQSRDKSRMELDSVLASVGGLVATSSRLQGEAEGDDLTKELAVFDRKVHHACRQMVDASNKEICELGVPFFCSGISDKVDRKELESLKKKMLQLLEDYCGSEDLES